MKTSRSQKPNFLKLFSKNHVTLMALIALACLQAVHSLGRAPQAPTPTPTEGPSVSVNGLKSPTASGALGNHKIASFNEAKKIAAQIHADHTETIYCPCRYSGKTIDLKSCGYKIHKDARRAARLEWEHIVPAEAFGNAFLEWREGTPNCHSKSGKRFKGRKCAETNADFARMEADLYNLWPAVGELNGLRSNFSMAAISGPALEFGDCKARIQDRKFEPMEKYKGIVARDYFYMDLNYPGRGIISEKNRKLFEAWDRAHPPSAWECERAARIEKIQGNTNQILSERCRRNESAVR